MDSDSALLVSTVRIVWVKVSGIFIRFYKDLPDDLLTSNFRAKSSAKSFGVIVNMETFDLLCFCDKPVILRKVDNPLSQSWWRLFFPMKRNFFHPDLWGVYCLQCRIDWKRLTLDRNMHGNSRSALLRQVAVPPQQFKSDIFQNNFMISYTQNSSQRDATPSLVPIPGVIDFPCLYFVQVLSLTYNVCII